MTDPKYDNDLVNKAYVDKLLANMGVEITQLEYNKNYGSQPIPPYYVNDTYMDGTDVWICTTQRLIGSYTPEDWTKASTYVQPSYVQTYVAGVREDLQEYIDGEVADLQTQIDGVMDFWFYEGVPTLENEPASQWTTDQLKHEHIGDIYVNMSTADSYRFVYYESTYSWLQQSDSQAAQAYALAQNAIDIADNKRRVFVVTPTTPYDVGDLWSQGENKPLKICITAKSTGTYNESHWALASNADNTKTVIDGGLITTGTLQLQDGADTTKAGITANGTGDNNVRIWAGQTYANRTTAPFRVTQAGVLTATGANISGVINATSGSIGGTTTVDGGRITTGKIATNLLNSDVITTSNLSAQTISANQITSGAIESDNYVANTSGTKINLVDGVIDTKNFKVTSTGIITATNGNFSGTLTSVAGTIGGWNLSSSGLTYGSTNATARGISSTGTTAFYAGHLTPSSAPFNVTQAGVLTATGATVSGVINATSGTFNGTVTATSGSIGNWNINSSGIYSGTTDSQLYRDGRLRMCPTTGGRLNAGSAGFLINGDGTGVPVVISDYITEDTGASGYSIGIRAKYGSIRTAVNYPYSIKMERVSGGYVEVGANVNLQGGYVLIEQTKVTNSTIESTSGAIGIHAIGSSYVYAKGGPSSAVPVSGKIKTTAGDSSSRILKTNINEFNNNQYTKAIKLLKKMKIYEYDYKYKLYANKHQYGFIIDDLEKEEETKEFFDFTDMLADVSNEEFDPTITGDPKYDVNNLPENIIKYKEYDSDVLDKYLLTICKAQQMKIDDLEERIQKLEKGGK